MLAKFFLWGVARTERIFFRLFFSSYFFVFLGSDRKREKEEKQKKRKTPNRSTTLHNIMAPKLADVSPPVTVSASKPILRKPERPCRREGTQGSNGARTAPLRSRSGGLLSGLQDRSRRSEVSKQSHC